MHFHLPKPLHGWREFAGEVGIIVIGVLIALGAEQLVEAAHWRREVNEARDAMALELGDSIGQSYERQRIDRCMEGRLNEIAELLDAADKSGRLPPISPIGSPPWRTWVHQSWDSTKAGQVASHFSRRELTNRGAAYEFVEFISPLQARELDAWSELSVLVGPGRAIDKNEIALMRRAAAQARMLHRLITGAAIRLRQIADLEHLPYDHSVADEDKRVPWAVYDVCQPIRAAIRPSYNYAPFEGDVKEIIANPLPGYGLGKLRAAHL